MITYIRGENPGGQSWSTREEWDMRETTMRTPKPVRKEGRRCARVQIPLQPMVKQQAVPLQSMEINGGADAHHYSPQRTTHQSK